MNFWKTHTKLRVILIIVFLIAGLIMTISGWRMTGQLSGLGRMLIGVLCLLIALWTYNKPFSKEKINHIK